MTVNFAVVGAGMIGETHCRAITGLGDAARLAVVADTAAPLAAAMAHRHGAAAHTDDVAAVLRSPDVDVVAICTPSGTHADLAVPALDAGKDVVIEKPLDVSLAAADAVIAAERRSGRTVAVISQHRFDRATEKVLAAVHDGGLGTLTSASASCIWWRGQSYYNSAGWRGTWALDGGGATMNQAIHTLDLLLAVLGTPVEVSAYTACLAHTGIEVEDTAVAVVRFASGALATVHATTAAYPGVATSLKVFGSKGSAVIEADELTFLHANPGQAAEIAMGEKGEGLNQVTDADRLTEADRSPASSHTAQLRDFLAARRGEQRVRVGTAEARAVLALILGMYTAARTGAPVRL